MTGESKRDILHTSSKKTQEMSKGILGCGDRGKELCSWAAALWEML